jgi:hypothetical protein
MGRRGSQLLTLALGLLGCALGSLQKPKLFGTFKASEVSRTPVKVASVSIECSLNACALRRKVYIAGMRQVTFCARKGGRKLVFFSFRVILVLVRMLLVSQSWCSSL